jgi:plasmid maintenance system killer protein
MEQTYFRKLQVVKEAKNEEEDNDDIELPESKRFESEKSDLFGDLD